MAVFVDDLLMLFDHHTLAAEYDTLKIKAERDKFCATHGVRQLQLNRLPYWNPIHMTIIDPMHNILLGMFVHFLACEYL